MDNILKYFAGEKMQCSIGIVLGLLGLALSFYFLSLHKAVFKGVSYTFIPLAFFLVAICIGIVLRTPKDIKRVTTFYESEPTKMKTEELPRMEKVMKTFPIIKKVELVFIAFGIALILFFGKNEIFRGVGIGLVIQGLMLYGFDHLAEARGKIYFEFLKSVR